MISFHLFNMIVKALKTHKIEPLAHGNYGEFVDQYITELEEKNIVAITSKAIAIMQGRVVRKGVDKNKLIEKEADLFIPPNSTKYPFYLTIKNNILIPNAGIDESNADNHYILWPVNPQRVVNDIRAFLVKKFKRKHVGVILTDSTTSPLRWGVRGIGIVHSGFDPVYDYVGKKDLFGRRLEVTKVNIMDALAASAVFKMGEGAEQTPIAIISDISHITFQERDPTPAELDSLKIAIDDDIYAPILKSVQWSKK